jgi:hypothetical protein
MQFNTKGSVGSLYLSALFVFGFTLTACSSSDDPAAQPPVVPSAVEAGIYDATVVEGADDLEFVISLVAASSETVSVDYATADGTAVAGTDYTATNGTVQFAPGEVRQFVTVAVLNNSSASSVTSRNMQLMLSNPNNAELSIDSATGTIIDKDVMSTDDAFSADWTATGAFTNAAICGEACHKSDNAAVMYFDSKDISPGSQWQHSVMAHSFNDPYWQAAVEDEADSFPELAGFIEDTCTKCHAPMGRTHAYHTNNDLDIDGHYRFNTAKSENHAREGVSCTLCHQIENIGLGTEDTFSGNYTIPDASDANYKRIYGQYPAPVTSPNNMFNQTGHTPTEGQYVTQSELCATCHTLYTPALDPATGMPSGDRFLEQGPFLEWKNSVYATGQPQEAQCQDCHMPEPTGNYQTPITLMPGTAPNRSPYGQHTLVGGNTHLLEILNAYRAELGIDTTTTAAGFAEQIALTRNFLAGAATVSVSAPMVADNLLSFDVETTNHAGHKLPSAYPSRRSWLHITVRDSGGNVIFESGKPDTRGYISTDEARLKADCMSAHKLDGFDTSVCYEPHHDVITDPAQVAIYETVLGDINGNITHTLLQGAQYLKDNRIPPAGFKNANAIEAQTIPSGVDGDDDFNCIGADEGCGKDTVHYQVDVEGNAGPYTVEAELLYQATQPAFVDGMHNTGDRVNRFKVMYDQVPPTVEILATATSP